MIIHRRIHRLRASKVAEGIELLKKLNELGRNQLGKGATIYQPDMLGCGLSRGHVVVDTVHESFAAMEEYYRAYFSLPALSALAEEWNDVEEETWTENYTLIDGG